MPKKPKRKVKNTRRQKPVYNRTENNNHDRYDTSDSDVDVDEIKIEVLDTPIKSEKDVNAYRVVKLPNGIVALLVSLPGDASGKNDNSNDSARIECCGYAEYIPNGGSKLKCAGHGVGWSERMTKTYQLTQRASIYLTVGAGSFSDPRQVPGVSNFVSGSILGKSRKYPDEGDDFVCFLMDCGGDERQIDSADTTTFCVHVPEAHFVETIDRFAHCFISPLMERDQINALRESFEADYVINAQSREFMEERGKEHLFANLASARHPAKTLGPNNPKGLFGLPDDQVYKEVVKFRERHYSAHRMTLVLKAGSPLETLELYAKKYFSTIPNNRLPPRDLSQYNFANSFDAPKSRKIYTMKPTIKRESYALELFWSLPPSHWLYRSKPRDYLAALLQHEGEGSLVAYLRMKNWCTKVVIGDRDSDFADNSVYCLFSVKILLTQVGHNNRRKVLDAVFSYINMLRRAGPQERIFDELRKIEDTKFRFGRNFEPIEILEDICVGMQHYPPMDYLTGKHLYLEYDYVSLKTCMELLTPERATIVVYDKDYNKSEMEAMSIEERFFICFGCGPDCDPHTKFHTSTDVPDDWINHWKNVEPMACFELPKSNSYLPDNFSLIPSIKDPPRYPVKIHTDALSEVWYKPDAKFRLPQCCMCFHYVSPLPLAEPENAAMLDLFVGALIRVSVEELYPAIAAGLKCQITTTEKGLVIEAHGFSQKLPCLMQTISRYIAKCSKLVNVDLFQRIKLEQEETYRESLLDNTELCNDLTLSILRLVHWTTIDKQAALSGIKFNDFQRFLERFVDRVYLQCLVQGNISKAAVIENTRDCLKLVNNKPLLASTVPRLRFHELPRGERCCRVKNFESNASFDKVTNYYQIGETTSHRLSVMIDLLIMMINSPIFHGLREREGLDAAFLAHKDVRGMFAYSLASLPKIRRMQLENPLLACLRTSELERIDETERNIEIYRKNWNLTVKSMSEKELQGMKTILLAVKMRPDQSLRYEVTRNWLEILFGDFTFNRREQEIAAIRALDLEDMRKWLAHLTTDGSKLRKLSVQVCRDADNENRSIKKTKDNRKDSKTECNGYDQHGITYLTDLPEGKEKRSDNYYIDDIANFKMELKILPILRRVGASAKTLNPPSQSTPKPAATRAKVLDNEDCAF